MHAAPSTWKFQTQQTARAGRSRGPDSPESPVDPTNAPSKPCHNCRRQRLRCDRSYPYCNKCAATGKECLGYGKLFRWTGAVASRGKLAWRTSSAPVDAAREPAAPATPQADKKPNLHHPTPIKSSPPDLGLARDVGARADFSMPEHTSHVQLLLTSPSAERLVASPWPLADPLYQDMQHAHRYYLSYFAASAAHMSNLVRAPLVNYHKDADDGVSAGIERASRCALQDALVAKSTALTLMRGAVEDINTTGPDVVLAAALFFINVELIESGKHGWKAHLEAAGRIMCLLQPDVVADTALRDYLLSDCFIYFVLASAFMPAASPFDVQSYFQPSQIPSILRRAADNSYFCCPPEILTILYSASQLSNVPPDVASEDDIRAAGLVLIQQAQAFNIKSWANGIRNLSYLRNVPVQSRIHTGSAHRLAACLYILQAVPSMSNIKDHREMVEALSCETFEHLSSIPDDDPNFKATAWPTFIAGAEAAGRARREWVIHRLQRLVRCCPWGFIYTAMETLQTIWDLENTGQRTKSWVHTLKDPQMNFLIV
ncbi:acriflavine sensitivity control protein acr-2 [Metarhizium album ARSEF 1941]|uniref:Acriflavine sensitivity control protein acr-2 n=1 Tax=Metarhizium album (strain ARSEF 1941) TaxID=1081103 RepID=A0A0B2X7B0_METAS|nr:acriflavine sensitivity control protein acr-2 [Metarhizium album ARSEF 1941]KHO01380.1 acriflavine sensitivity control protein acr-2 [Metarhizium album ARSEF 1941]